MLGSDIELKWNRKDLGGLDVAMTYVRNRKQVVQAGGCLGVFPKAMSALFTTVYTFEPDVRLFRMMCQNVQETNVMMFQAALGCRPHMVHTECSLRPNDGKTVLHDGMTRTEPGGSDPVLRIDAFNFKELGLIYLDVEGDEFQALQGAQETLYRCRPTIACEINRGIEYKGETGEQLRSFLRQRGYSEVAKHRSDFIFRHDEMKEET